VQALIPGAYERNTLTHSQPGSMSGQAFGSDDIPTSSGLLDAATIADRQWEGGGAPSQRRELAGSRRKGDALRRHMSGAAQQVSYGCACV
jgi:hypothetical protein